MDERLSEAVRKVVESVEPESEAEADLDNEEEEAETPGGNASASEYREPKQLRLGEDFARPEDIEDAPGLKSIHEELSRLESEKKRLEKRRKIYARQVEYLGVVSQIERARSMSALEKGSLFVVIDAGFGIFCHTHDARGPVGWEDVLLYAAFRGGEAVELSAARGELGIKGIGD
ncbi:MAG: hypothetical protein LBO82_06540 [Synergistaceae bacterium]|jgi:hypothetical protein|nr:hypothetical protein [Synergistaceae bacterium]